MQEQVLAVSLAAVAAIAAVFAKVPRELQPGEAGWSAAEAAANLRARLLWGSLVMGAAIALLTLVPWPHAVATGPEVVSVTVRALVGVGTRTGAGPRKYSCRVPRHERGREPRIRRLRPPGALVVPNPGHAGLGE